MNYAEARKVHMARALVFNPEVLVIHKPGDDADNLQADRILGLFREVVELRGVVRDGSSRANRRRRPVILSTCGARRRQMQPASFGGLDLIQGSRATERTHSPVGARPQEVARSVAEGSRASTGPAIHGHSKDSPPSAHDHRKRGRLGETPGSSKRGHTPQMRGRRQERAPLPTSKYGIQRQSLPRART